jgi:hypothetical protein
MPEPWRVERVYSNGCEVCPRIMAGREIVAEVCGAPHIGFVDTLPRAHLMAATQELFEACQRFLDAHQAEIDARQLSKPSKVIVCQCGPCVMARAAITKATQEAPA